MSSCSVQAALWRIIRYYLLLRRQEASGIPFDPEDNLSLENYMRVLVWLDPKGYNVRLRGSIAPRPENLDFYYEFSEDENADSDEPVACDDDVDDAVLDGRAEGDDMARIENAVLDPPGDEDADDDIAEIENGVLDAPNIFDAGFANVDEAFVDDDDLNAPVANDDDIPAVLDAPVEEN
ncbi:hypothetical protein TNCV_3022541 [Trichonephila clavipes]|nr:hypothetical protein TNCV_3022541 [Trichonephila clavipes]